MQDKNAQKVKTTAPRRGAGRPRALTLDEILDAAIQIGLAGISMPALAAKLGTGPATLYNYVANRDELVRLAAQRKAGRPTLDDLGQTWRDLVRAHARGFLAFWTSEPQLFHQYMQGSLDPDMLFDYVEAFLAAMARRGFAAEQAYRIMASVNTLVLGAMVRGLYLQGMAERGHTPGMAAKRVLSARDDAELPHLRSCIDFAVNDKAYDFDDALERVIESFSPSSE